MRILVTGATGFVGRMIVPALEGAGHAVIAPARADAALEKPESFGPFMQGVDAVIHLAAHNPPRWRPRPGDGARFRALNVEATAALAEQALHAGVKTFVFLSSARVYGIQDLAVYGEDTPARPNDSYGASKWQAEQALAEIFASAPERLLILRTPVIYGPGRGGVLGLVSRFARNGWPFPAHLATARKSILHGSNLASALQYAVGGAPPLGGTFNLCDGPSVTLGDIGHIVAGHHHRTFATMPLPRPAVSALSALPVIGPAMAHLAAPCVLDCAHFAQATGWQAPISSLEGIAASFTEPHRPG